MQHDGDQLHAVPLCRGGEAVPRGGGIAGLQTGRPVVEADKLIRVGQAELPVADGVHPDGCILFDGLMARNVIGCGQMLGGLRLVVESCAVDEARVGHAKLFCARVHHLDERRLAACDVLGHRAGAVVCRGDHDGFEHLLQRELLVFLEIDLAPALGGGCGGRLHHVVPADAPIVQRLHDQQQRHHLRHARRAEAFVCVVLQKHLAGRPLHQHVARRGQVKLCRAHRRQQRPGQQHQQHKDCEHPLFHKKSPFRFIWYKPMKRKGMIVPGSGICRIC